MEDKQKISVWLDDERQKPDSFDIHVYTSQDAIDVLSQGNVEYISLDHDLGEDSQGTGYDVAKWIEEKAFNQELDPIAWNVHSANPVGRERISGALMNADKFWASRRDEHSHSDIQSSLKRANLAVQFAKNALFKVADNEDEEDLKKQYKEAYEEYIEAQEKFWKIRDEWIEALNKSD